eukprot:NODE_932_length_2992_cov_0.336675.p1 type:complete len:326 gc:universal NODE_932_length_2992_cov_0.336675:779-1756(+)
MTLNIYLKGDLNDVDFYIRILKSESENIADRFHALFTLRTLFSKNQFNPDLFVNAIYHSLSRSTALLQHELCYVLGQFQNAKTRTLQIKYLNAVLFGDFSDIVRHEAAEALGALGGEDALARVLSEGEVRNDSFNLVRDTIYLSIQKYRYEKANGKISSYYDSIDPAPALESRNLDELNMIVTSGADIVQKYSAMFAIRNLIYEYLHGSTEQKSIVLASNKMRTNILPLAIKYIASGLKDSSVLLRHEVAYIFGQLLSELSVPYLESALRNTEEHPIVRHECAEALGAIGKNDVLHLFVNDKEQIVRESCLVGLKIGDYCNLEHE